MLLPGCRRRQVGLAWRRNLPSAQRGTATNSNTLKLRGHGTLQRVALAAPSVPSLCFPRLAELFRMTKIYLSA